MRRMFLVCGAFLLASALSLGLLVNLRSANSAPLAAPDALLPIRLADGSDLPLADVLARVHAGLPLPEAPAPQRPAVAPAAPVAAPAASAPGPSARPVLGWRGRTWPEHKAAVLQHLRADYGPIVALARGQEFDRNYDQALALYLSIEDGEPGYAYAQRRIGWAILADARHQPSHGVPFVQEAVRRDPLNGRAWRDLGRVYAATLGFPIR